MGLGSIERDFDLIDEDRYLALQQPEVQHEALGELPQNEEEELSNDEENFAWSKHLLASQTDLVFYSNISA